MRVDVHVYTCKKSAESADIFKEEIDYIYIEFTEKGEKK